MIRAFYTLELLKLRKRLVTVTITLMHLVLQFFVYGGYAYGTWKYGGTYRLPEAWRQIVESGATITAIFSSSLLVILVASEFEWRTARQHLLDGMGRSAWLSAKLLLMLTICGAFIAAQLIFGVGAALVTTDFGAAEDMLTSTHVVAIAGLTLSTLLFGALALLVSVVLRSVGPALGLALIYPVFENIVARVLRGYELDWIADWLLFQVMNALIDYDQYLDSVPEAVVSQWASLPALFAAGLCWLLALVVGSCWHFTRKDA